MVAPIIYDEYVVDAKRSGRPGISLDKQQEIVAKVTTDRYGREKSTAEIARKVEVSQSSPQQRKPNKRCGSSDSRLASVKTLKPSGENEERALPLMDK